MNSQKRELKFLLCLYLPWINIGRYIIIIHHLIPDIAWFQECVAKERMVPEVQVANEEVNPGVRQTETLFQRWAWLSLTEQTRGEEWASYCRRSLWGAAKDGNKASGGRFLPQLCLLLSPPCTALWFLKLTVEYNSLTSGPPASDIIFAKPVTPCLVCLEGQ